MLYRQDDSICSSYEQINSEGVIRMSYYMSAKETIRIKNTNEDTRAFTMSVKKYIQDFLQGIRIESFYDFAMELTVDEKVIIGTYIGEGYQKGVIKLESIQFNEEGMRKVIENLEFHENLSLKLNYSGFFFYFYDYNINRFSKLLDEKLKGYVTYFASQQEEDALTAYQFNVVDGNLNHGYVKEHAYEKYKHIKGWKAININFYLELVDNIPWDIYNAAFDKAQEVADHFGLRLYFVSDSVGDSDGTSANPGALEMDRAIKPGEEVYKVTMASNEVEAYYEELEKIYNLLRDYMTTIGDEWQMIPSNEEDGEITLMLKVDDKGDLALMVFDPNAEDVEILPNDSVSSIVEQLEESMQNWDDVQVPMDDFLKRKTEESI